MTAELAVITSTAARQLGLVTAAQVKRLGVDRMRLTDLLSQGHLVEIDRDTFELVDNLAAMPAVEIYAAWLNLRAASYAWERPVAQGNPSADAVVSHESAAMLLGLGAPSATPTSFTAPAPLSVRRGIRVLVAELRPDEIVVSQGIPLTTPHRTIIDLVRDYSDHGEVARVLSDAVRRDLVDLAALYPDLQSLATVHHFPSVGSKFVRWFLSELSISDLSARNARALEELAND